MKKNILKVVKANIMWKEKIKLATIKNSNIKYSPLICFNGGDINEIWSCIVKNIEVIAETETIANISFLSPKAPNELLIVGNNFSLYEGSELVAYGKIID